jgi:hypothetical protein
MVLAALWASYFLILTLAFDAKGAVDEDVMIYLSIGRGIQNGLKMYTDLFESKPPGIFLLSWLSMWLTNGTGLMRTVQDFGLVVAPLSLAYISRQKWDRFLCAFVFGCLISLWSYSNSAGLETEIYGVFPMTLYAIFITSPMTQRKIILSGVCIFLATFFREPYILGILVAAILISNTTQEFINRFVYPVIVAAALYCLALICTGVLIPYVQVYLPGMLLDRIQTNDTGPLYLRAIWVQRLFSSLTIYSAVPLLGYLLTGLWLFVTVTKEKMSRSMIALSSFAMIIGAWGLGEYFVLLALFYRLLPSGFTWWTIVTDPGLWTIDALYAIGTILYAFLLLYIGRKNPRMLLHVFFGLSILLILGLAISLGGYGHRYLLFLLPVIVSLFLVALRRINTVILASIVAVLLITSRAPSEDVQIIKEYNDNRKASAQLDSLMGACGYKTYASGATTANFAFSKYSPTGPLFIFAAHTYLGYKHPLYQATIANILRQKLLVVAYPFDDNDMPSQLRNLFSAPEPECVKGHEIDGYKLFFKTGT